MRTNDSLVAGGNIALLIQTRDENKDLVTLVKVLVEKDVAEFDGFLSDIMTDLTQKPNPGSNIGFYFSNSDFVRYITSELARFSIPFEFVADSKTDSPNVVYQIILPRERFAPVGVETFVNGFISKEAVKKGVQHEIYLYDVDPRDECAWCGKKLEFDEGFAISIDHVYYMHHGDTETYKPVCRECLGDFLKFVSDVMFDNGIDQEE